ncbi:hypothetical protein [Powai lake megavirus]|uniref:Ankyrin repeat protein n=1 Tax=Powai lake megavirus TaxID=1842663 RepID=A0A160EQZ4_9VIRU|nr:hypothetical protein QJ849_gp959 [Powai lake megavirus]ANB51121.1 hypothetical protein [Powai lake megavirus]
MFAILDIRDEDYVVGKTYIAGETYITDESQSLFYTDIEHINLLYNKGTEIIVIEFPDHTNLNIIEWENNIYSTNIFKILKIYSLYEPLTYAELNLNLEENKYIIDYASGEGKIDFLNWCISSEFKLNYSESAITNACINNQTHILEWWITSNLPLKYSHKAINHASEQGNISILNIWLNSGLLLKYSHKAIDYCSDYETIEILDWWLNSGLELKYSVDAIDNASINGCIDVLDWWIKSGLELKYSQRSLAFHCSYCDENEIIKVLNWWIKSGLPLKYDNTIINQASIHGCFNILNWWLDSGLKMRYSEESLIFSDSIYNEDQIIEILNWWLNSSLKLCYDNNLIKYCYNYGYIKVLDLLKNYKLPIYNNSDLFDNGCHIFHIESELFKIIKWWHNSGLELKYTNRFIDNLSIMGHTKIINWILDNNLKFEYTTDALDYAKHVDMLEWWKKSGFELKYTNMSIDRLGQYGYSENILQWWFDSGLELRYTENSIKNALLYKNKILLKKWLLYPSAIKYMLINQDPQPEITTWWHKKLIKYQ